jgi:hypothetical protein
MADLIGALERSRRPAIAAREKRNPDLLRQEALGNFVQKTGANRKNAAMRNSAPFSESLPATSYIPWVALLKTRLNRS